jgi:hypothetical protein
MAVQFMAPMGPQALLGVSASPGPAAVQVRIPLEPTQQTFVRPNPLAAAALVARLVLQSGKTATQLP